MAYTKTNWVNDSLPGIDEDNLNKIEEGIHNIDVHASKTDNPHNVTKDQVGLGNVDNTADADKPVSSAVTGALNSKSDKGHTHDGADKVDHNNLLNKGSNTHTQIDAHIAEAITKADILTPVTSTNKIVTESDISGGGDSLAQHLADVANPHQVSKSQVGLGNVPNVDTTAAVAHPARTDNPHSVTKAQIGLENVDNTGDMDKPVSTATQAAINNVSSNFPPGFRNIFINGDFRINQRNFDGDWNALSVGEYGYDRWKKSGISDSLIEQVIEEGNYVPSATYAVYGDASYKNALVTAPTSGNFTIYTSNSNSWVMCIQSDVILTHYTGPAFERRPIGLELSLCQRYFTKESGCTIRGFNPYGGTGTGGIYDTRRIGYIKFPVSMRTKPTVTATAGVGTIVTVSNGLTRNGTSFELTAPNSGTQAYIDSYIADAEL